MTFLIDARWLLLIPFGLIIGFVLWVLWHLSLEIHAQKRRWIINYRETHVRPRPAQDSREIYIARPQSDRRAS